MNAIARRLYRLNFGKPRLASDVIRELLDEAATSVDGAQLQHSLFAD